MTRILKVTFESTIQQQNKRIEGKPVTGHALDVTPVGKDECTMIR